MSEQQQVPVEEVIRNLRNDIMNITLRATDIQRDISDHNRVIEALNAFEPDRRAFFMVGEIMVDGTVAEVAPRLVLKAQKLREFYEMTQKMIAQKNAQLEELTRKE